MLKASGDFFLTDENIFPSIVSFLRSRRFDVKDIREQALRGAPDEKVASLAQAEQRILLTFDKHFANILRYPPPMYYGLIRIRIHPPVLDVVLGALQSFLDGFNLENIKGKLVVLEREGYRIYPRIGQLRNHVDRH